MQQCCVVINLFYQCVSTLAISSLGVIIEKDTTAPAAEKKNLKSNNKKNVSAFQLCNYIKSILWQSFYGNVTAITFNALVKT